MPPACFHCGLPVAEPGRWRAPLLGEAREFCCAGCEAVAQTIAAGGFGRYYETRSAPAQRADPAAALPAATHYDEPAALREFAAGAPDRPGALEATFLIEHVRCSACLWLVEQALRRVPGVLRADVNFVTHRAQVACDPVATRPSALIDALRALGYDASPFDPRRDRAADLPARRAELWRLFVAGLGAIQVMM
jgi:Cu2+-exporting ATPase